MTVKFKDGTELSGDFYEVIEQIEAKYGHYPYSIESDQSYENPWGIGEHTARISMLGFTAEFTVTVEETPIESIEIEPIQYLEHTGGQWSNWTPDDNYMPDSWYYYYEDPQKITVRFKDGTVFSGRWYEVTEQVRTKTQYTGSIYSIGSNQYWNPWGVGEHTARISLLALLRFTAPPTFLETESPKRLTTIFCGCSFFSLPACRSLRTYTQMYLPKKCFPERYALL